MRKYQNNAIRIVETDKVEEKEVYQEWLKNWIGNYNNLIMNKAGNSFSLVFPTGQIEFSHSEGSDDKLEFRNHGVFKKTIEANWENLRYDVEEAMLSSIYAIDNRLNNVINNKPNRTLIESKLKLIISEESDESINNDWIKLKDDECFIHYSINFLVIHLSFIESINNNCYKNDINCFLKKIATAINGRKNFHLIISTGRGRTDWYEEIHNDYQHLCKFRSILSMQNALTDAVMIKDDFNLKYNFTKVLFGT